MFGRISYVVSLASADAARTPTHPAIHIARPTLFIASPTALLVATS